MAFRKNTKHFCVINITKMNTTIKQTISNVHTQYVTRPSIISQFMNWCSNQDKNRYGWLGAAVTSHGCIITPLTMFAIILSGNNIIFWFLAALPTKITIPIFLFSIMMDVAVISACAVAGCNIAGTYS
jgi:hypothetical protein